VSRQPARFLVLLWLGGIAASALAEEPHRASAAMRIAMLSERVAKLQAQAGQGILAERSRRAMPEALRDMESSIRVLTARAPGAEMQENYVLLGILAREYRQWALKPPTRENAKKLAERAEEIAWVASKNARLAQERMRTPAGTLALHAAQAGMLAQRVPRLHLMRHWGVRDGTLTRELEFSSEELRRNIELLGAAAQATPEIEGEVQVSRSQYEFLAQSARDVESGKSSARQIEFIAKTGDHILESMERVTALYEALAR
jgi:hypothetical protein